MDADMNFELRVENGRPFYEQLADEVRRRIKQGIIKPGDMIPSEAELCQKHMISRSTVRQALGVLEKEGYLVRRRGKGTFVSQPKLNRSLDNLYSFTSQIRASGFEPRSVLVSYEIREAPEAVAEKFGLDGDKRLLYIARIRYADEQPMLYECTYLPLSFAGFIKKEMLEKDSLYEMMRRELGVTPFRAVEAYEPVKLSRDQAEKLKCPERSCAFAIERVAYDERDSVIEYTRSVMSGERSRFEINLFKDGVSVNRRYGG